MRKVVYGGACSLDGFLAGRGGAIDWLHYSDDVKQILAKTWANTDALLIGRKTWDFSVAAGGGGRMKGVQSYLFSRTLTASPARGVELVREHAGDFVRALKAAPGRDIVVMSGGNLAASLFAGRPERAPAAARLGRACVCRCGHPRAAGARRVPSDRRRLRDAPLSGGSLMNDGGPGIADGRDDDRGAAGIGRAR
jgi:dihydrofolate reductase